MVTSAQLRAARSLLNWTVRDLAENAGVHRNTVSRAEGEENEHGHAVAQMIRTLEAGGVIFVEENGEGPGVRLRKNWAFEGLDAIAAHLGVNVGRAAEIIASGELESFETHPGSRPCVSQDAMREYKRRR